MNRWKLHLPRGWSVLLIGATVALTGCVVEHPYGYDYPPPAPYGVAYTYFYYPDAEVYFCEDTHLFFWFEYGGWHSGPRCPRTIVLRPETRVVVKLNTPQPWREHVRIRASYPHVTAPHVIARYHYEYYPNRQVYYRPDAHAYYWQEGGTWRSGAHPPGNMKLRSQNSVNVDLDSPEPSRHHDEVRAKHPARDRDRDDRDHDDRRSWDHRN